MSPSADGDLPPGNGLGSQSSHDPEGIISQTEDESDIMDSSNADLRSESLEISTEDDDSVEMGYQIYVDDETTELPYDSNDDITDSYISEEDDGTGIEFTVDADGEVQAVNSDATIGGAEQGSNPSTAAVTREQLLRILGNHPGIRQLLGIPRGRETEAEYEDEEDEDEDDDSDYIDDDEGQSNTTGYSGRSRSKKTPKVPIEERYPPVPNPAGVELMSSGVFGSNDIRRGYAVKQKKGIALDVLKRELGQIDSPKSRLDPRYISQCMIPSSTADAVIHYDARCYSGQFSDDGDFFFSCSQDFNVRMYDTSNPYKWRYYKRVRCTSGRWTITDASLSPDNKYLAYSSITPVVGLASTDPAVDSEPHMLDLSFKGSSGRTGPSIYGGYSRFGIFSIRFSGDGRELVAGTTENSVYVYDLETRQSVLEIAGHDDDVNAVCFGDKSSPHILYSGSDDSTLKVWDRRSMGDGREAGAFVGHTQGLTYIDSKGDGRYVLSNSKDQTMKLWDLRKMVTPDKFDRMDSSYRRGIRDFDYRQDTYYKNKFVPDPNDCSVVTFRGHSVMRTLIRCHFSPPGSTNSRYVYSGSKDGILHIYNLDGTVAGQINVNDATRQTNTHTRNRGFFRGYDDDIGGSWMTCVRDASWHPTAPVIAATAWDGGGMESGTCSVFSWKDNAEDDEGLPKMGVQVNEKLAQEPEPSRASARNLRPRFM